MEAPLNSLLVQVLVLVFLPPPHVTLNAENDDQADQPPSTAARNSLINKKAFV